MVGVQDEARDLRHEHVGVEHMLLGVLRLPPEQVTSRVLASFGVEGGETRERLRELVAPGQLVAGPCRSRRAPSACSSLRCARR